MDERQIRQALVRGLVGHRIDLYQRSANFHAQIDALADMLPLWVDGLAARAEQADAAMERSIEAIKAGPLLGLGIEGPGERE